MTQDSEDTVKQVEKTAIKQMRQWGIWLLRVSLGIVFFWFGLLKIFNVSPVQHMIEKTYTFTVERPEYIIFLGIIEVLIGLGLIFKVYLKTTLILLWLQIAGILLSVFFHPPLFFNGNPFFLTLEGEFVVKNLIILAASIVIGGYRSKPMERYV
ncbi:MAG: hypothetical protein H0X51_00410 [Parachlamydiaceae bacterium]|nr:hypothetical protein [Parachlamydiaceae bacterium]